MSEEMAIERKPIRAIASFVDDYGDQRVIHRGKKGRRLSVFSGPGTPQQRINRAAAILLGQNIKARRLEVGISQRELCVAAGLVNANPKQYISAIERAARQEGVRLGTLFAIARALRCEPGALLPDTAAVLRCAGVRVVAAETIEVTP